METWELIFQSTKFVCHNKQFSKNQILGIKYLLITLNTWDYDDTSLIIVGIQVFFFPFTYIP